MNVRACFHCRHSRALPGTDGMRCMSFAVNGAAQVQRGGTPIEQARAYSGPCGPEARFLSIKTDPLDKGT